MLKITLAEELSKGKDRYDPNTICGCLNRIKRIADEERKRTKTLSEKYNIDPEADRVSWIFWKLQEASFWPADELDYSRLKEDYVKTTPAIRRALDLINGWFAGGDGIIVQNIAFRFALESKSMSEMGALLTQMKQEFVHGETYLKIIQAMIGDPIRRREILKIADNMECVKQKELLMEKYMECDIPLAVRIVAFACAEGIGFWASFAPIFWLKSQGIFMALADLNELISKDEGMHRDYACARYRNLPENQKMSYENVLRVVNEFVEVEENFADVIAGPLEDEGYDLTPDVLKKFVRFMANNLLVGLGYETHYEDAKFPEYMRNISGSSKANFYEVNVGSYRQFSMNENKSENNSTIDEDVADFDADEIDF